MHQNQVQGSGEVMKRNGHEIQISSFFKHHLCIILAWCEKEGEGGA